jgi:hypothetical protein
VTSSNCAACRKVPPLFGLTRHNCAMVDEVDDSGHQPSGAEVFAGLRAQALAITAAELGLPPDLEVVGLLMDTSYPNGAATLLVVADGTVSLYLSSGGGMIGAGARASVAVPARELLAVSKLFLSEFAAATSTDLPPAGWTSITLLTPDGPRGVTAPEEDFGYRRHPASPVFHAAHQVITELRILQEGSDVSAAEN